MQPLDEEMLTNLAKEPAVIEGHSITNLELICSMQHLQKSVDSIINVFFNRIVMDDIET